MISGAIPSINSVYSSSAVTAGKPVVAGAREPGPVAPSLEQDPSSSVHKSAGDPRNVPALDEAQLRELTELKARDREVRAHEAAHKAVGGQHAGAISYDYQRGPDGARYAVGGEVSIDISPVQGDPEATIEKMRVVRAAAMAPAEPSSQDRAVAAEATQIMLQAQTDLYRQASDTYQSVSKMNDSDTKSERSSFQSVMA
ncbi:putative metalloprotease CJM1_0395 family protein [Marinobacter lipolyticus]|uniref:putative metalloprotease CJM1_0395 family protein n=1 Tax=Marinobacter lipolyticus TaxID=209639 RepID=UPI003A9177DE